jgi:hypothetical protein
MNFATAGGPREVRICRFFRLHDAAAMVSFSNSASCVVAAMEAASSIEAPVVPRMAVLTSPVRSFRSATPADTNRNPDSRGLQHLLPNRQSPSVSELSTRLYAAYEVQGGNVRLAGCALELRPIVHLTALCRASAAEAAQPLELFLGDDGLPLEANIAEELNLADFVAGDRPTRFPSSMLNDLVDRARWLLAENCREAGSKLDDATIETEIFWRRFAEGKLRFTIGDQSVVTTFADWADRLLPPAFVCPETGVKTFQVAVTDDGRIVAADEIAVCEQTNRRMLRGETVVCSVTGRRLAADLAQQCPITEQPVQHEQLTTCAICQMKVSPSAIDGHQCRACAASSTVKKSDPRMCLVLGEHPGLDRWRRFRLAETPQAYVLEARSLMQRLLVVVEKQTLEVKRLARRGRFQSAWNDVEPEGWREWLQ